MTLTIFYLLLIIIFKDEGVFGIIGLKMISSAKTKTRRIIPSHFSSSTRKKMLKLKLEGDFQDNTQNKNTVKRKWKHVAKNFVKISKFSLLSEKILNNQKIKYCKN